MYKSAEDALYSVFNVPSDDNQDADLESDFDSNGTDETVGARIALDPLFKAQAVNDQ